MAKTILTILKVIFILIIGLFFLSLRPSIAMSLKMAPIPALSSLYFREVLALVVSLLILMTAIAIASKGNLRLYGFVSTRHLLPVKPMLAGFLVGAISTAIGTVAGFEGPKEFSDMTLIQTVLLIWLIASVYEEVVVRGFIQGSLSFWQSRGISIRSVRLSLPVIISALFFGLSHLALLTMGADVRFVILVVAFAMVVGFLTAYYREKTGSLIPAILIHIVANMGGTAAGWLF